MKIRNGFVSNSSSSSFIIIGKQTYDTDLKVGDYVVGRSLNDGSDGFTIANKKMLKFVQENSHLFHHFFTDVRIVDSDGKDTVIDVRDVGNKLFSFTKDYYSSDDLEKLKENYLREIL